MVDVGDKDETERVARAEARVVMAPATLALIQDEAAPKGDVLAVARLAGIMAAKRTTSSSRCATSSTSPPCGVDIEADEELPGLRIVTEARLRGRTGVEMEALTAASVAALTVYDMCKAVDRGMEVDGRAPAREERRPQRRTGGDAGRGRSTTAEASSEPAQRRDGRVVSVNVAAEKGVQKTPWARSTLVVEHGIEGDAHAGPWHRQVSLLASESIEKMSAAGPDVGARAPSARTSPPRASCVYELPVGTRMRVGPSACSRSPRSARSATTAAPSSTRSATA